MFEWSKEICNKIAESGCLTPKELGMVEISLRVWDAYDELLNENLALDNSNFFELEHSPFRNKSNKE